MFYIAEGEYILTEQGTNERSGSGSHVTTDGTKYAGEWQGDKMNGTGRIEFPSGSSYEGVFVNNRFEGKGTYTWPNGSHYDGLFSESRRVATYSRLSGYLNFNNCISKYCAALPKYNTKVMIYVESQRL